MKKFKKIITLFFSLALFSIAFVGCWFDQPVQLTAENIFDATISKTKTTDKIAIEAIGRNGETYDGFQLALKNDGAGKIQYCSINGISTSQHSNLNDIFETGTFITTDDSWATFEQSLNSYEDFLTYSPTNETLITIINNLQNFIEGDLFPYVEGIDFENTEVSGTYNIDTNITNPIDSEVTTRVVLNLNSSKVITQANYYYESTDENYKGSVIFAFGD